MDEPLTAKRWLHPFEFDIVEAALDGGNIYLETCRQFLDGLLFLLVESPQILLTDFDTGTELIATIPAAI